MSRRIIACYFNTQPNGSDQWSRMARVLDRTARLHCPSWDISIQRIYPPAMTSPSGSIAYVANTQKLDYWTAQVAAAPDGTEVMLMDVDTFIVGPLDEAFAPPFDFAYTERDQSVSPYPINAGVVFLRTSARVRDFMERWRAENACMLQDRARHRPWCMKYAGINQAALGKILESGAVDELGISLAKLPCAEWNCEDSAWQHFHPARTRIVHIKSALRLGIFALSAIRPDLRPLVNLWRGLERGAGVARA